MTAGETRLISIMNYRQGISPSKYVRTNSFNSNWLKYNIEKYGNKIMDYLKETIQYISTYIICICKY